MTGTKRFSVDIVAALDRAKLIGLRAGSGEHRLIGIWAVVVEGRVFVRSWSLKPRSWWRTFLEDPSGIMTLDDRELPVRAVHTRSERLKKLVSRAYLANNS